MLPTGRSQVVVRYFHGVRDAGGPGDEPLPVDLLDVFDVDFVHGRLLEDNG
jgi:hypothetical protein